MAIMGTFAAMSDPGHAEPTVPSPADWVSQPPTSPPVWPVGIANTSPRVSDAGDVVVFDSMTGTDVSTARAMVRAAGTTTAVPDAPSLHPGLSGDGCVVAYSMPATANQIELVAFDRCASTPATEVIARVPAPVGSAARGLPAPALSDSGSVVVWSTGVSVVRYEKPNTAWIAETIVVPPSVDPSATVVASVIDVSANGATIVFAAGPGTAPSEPTPTSNIFRWVAGPTGTPGTVTLASPRAGGSPSNGSSTAPSISADGRFVVFQSDSTDLVAAGVPTGSLATYVVLLDLGTTPTATPTSKVLAPDAERPVISGDGSTVAYGTSTDVHLKRSSGSPPFVSVTDVSLSLAADGTTQTGPSVSAPGLSANGAVGVFDSTAGGALVGDPQFPGGTHVFARTVVEVIPPTTPPTTAAPTTTIRPTTTAPAPTTTEPLPSTTVPATTVVLRPVTPTTTAPPFRPSFPGTGSSGGGSSSGSSRPIGSTTVTFQPSGPIEEATFVPVGVDFSPTIVGIGRQVTTLSLTNPTSGSIDVIDTSIQNDPDGAYLIVDSTCDDSSIPPGGQCTLTVAFAPVTLGASSASLVATLSNGTSATALLAGTGAPPPILTVVPGVAASGQAVAVQGSGFPADLVVELTWLGSNAPEQITVGADGSFVETLIVLPHTPRGPGTAVVTGQTDQFSDVTGNVVITDTADRSSWVLTRSASSPFVS